MSSVFQRDPKQAVYEPVPLSDHEVLVVGLEERVRRKKRCRRIAIWFISFMAFLFVGHMVYKGASTLMFVHKNVECVPYEGGMSVVKIPIVDPRAKVLVDSSVSSHDVFIAHVEGESNEITFTLEAADGTPETTAEIRLCTLRGRKLTGLGIFAHKKVKHEDEALPVIKSLKIEIPSAITTPSIDLLPPKRGCHKVSKLLKWAGVWNPEHPQDAKLD